MADRITGFGRTIEEFENYECVKEVHEIYNRMTAEMQNDKIVRTLFGSLSIDDVTNIMADDGVDVCELDEYGFELLGKCVGIPSAYLKRLNDYMKIVNIRWWIGQFNDKELELRIRGGHLVDATTDIEIKIVDVMRLINMQLPCWSIINIANMTNSTQFDIVDLDNVYATDKETYSPGIRVIVRRGLNAPIISPIFLNQESCAIIDLGEPDDEFAIKGFSYNDVLNLITDRIRQCVKYIEPSFKRFCEFCNDDVPKPRRRASLYCREHGIPDRARAYVVDVFDELNITKATYEELVSILSSMPYSDGVSSSTAKKFQLVAGHVMFCGPKEGRCKACDAVMIES